MHAVLYTPVPTMLSFPDCAYSKKTKQLLSFLKRTKEAFNISYTSRK